LPGADVEREQGDCEGVAVRCPDQDVAAFKRENGLDEVVVGVIDAGDAVVSCELAYETSRWYGDGVAPHVEEVVLGPGDSGVSGGVDGP
jgi:hypothetical protein